MHIYNIHGKNVYSTPATKKLRNPTQTNHIYHTQHSYVHTPEQYMYVQYNVHMYVDSVGLLSANTDVHFVRKMLNAAENGANFLS